MSTLKTASDSGKAHATRAKGGRLSALEGPLSVPCDWKVGCGLLFSLRTPDEVRAYVKAGVEESPDALVVISRRIVDSFGRALQKIGHRPTPADKTGIQLFACPRTADILAEEILSQDKPDLRTLQYLFLLHPEKETLKRTINKLLDAYGTGYETLDVLGGWMAFMHNPNPIYWSFACPNADSAFGEVVLERPGLLDKLMEDSKYLSAINDHLPICVRKDRLDDRAIYVSRTLLGAASAITDDLALITTLFNILVPDRNDDFYLGMSRRIIASYEEGRFDSVSDPNMLVALFKCTSDLAVVQFVIDRLLFTENENGLLSRITYEPHRFGLHGSIICQAVDTDVLAKFNPKTFLHREIARRIIEYSGSDAELALAARGLLSHSKEGRRTLAEIAAPS
ncbi:MAG: hypothetical protein WCT31_05090 [Candidatus Micrarchaeia archaeon]|jgi:hypothetical protein